MGTEPRTADQRCARIAGGQAGIITRQQALDAGMRVSTIDHRVRGGSWSAAHEGVYRMCSADPPWLSEVAAAAIAVGGAAIGSCAAGVWGLDGFEPKGEIQVVTGNGRRLRGSSVVVARGAWFSEGLVTRRSGVPVLQPSWTLLTLGDYRTRDAVEGALDDCLRRRFTDWKELEGLVELPSLCNHAGAAVVRELLTLRRQRRHTDSYLETRMLQLLRDRGFPDPVLQFPIDVGGGLKVHADFGFPDQGVLVETVGVNGHRSELWQYASDCRRNNAVSLLDRFVVLHYTWKQVIGRPEEVTYELASALCVPLQEPFRIIDRRGGPALLALPLR
jgi:hypothetical protein